MKKGLHPEYVDCTVTCSCGNSFKTRSTKSELKIDICNSCHPFFTGQQKFVDTGGRVQRFSDRFGSGASIVEKRKKAEKEARAAKVAAMEEKKAKARQERAKEKAKRTSEYEKKVAKLKAKQEALDAEVKAGDSSKTTKATTEDSKDKDAKIAGDETKENPPVENSRTNEVSAEE